MVRERRNTSSKAVEIIVGVFLLLLGVGLLIGASCLAISQNAKIAKWPHVTATVVDTVVSYNSDHEAMYSDVLEYSVNGKTIRVKSNISSSIPSFINSTEEIAYNPDVPTDFVYTKGGNRYVPIIIMFVVGGGFTVVAVLLFATKIVKARKAKQLLRENSTELLKAVHDDMYFNGNGYSDNDNVHDRYEEPYEKLHYGDE